MAKDTIFAQAPENPSGFRFDHRVAEVFDDMARRSIPGYADIIFMLRVLAGKFVVADSNCYDLGCSLGASALSVRAGIECPGCRIVAVDNSPAMVERCRENIAAAGEGAPVPVDIDVVCDDIRNIEFSRASMVVLNFTLQFLPVADRTALLRQIYDGMLPGGILVLSEKITHKQPFTQELLIDIYHEWKRRNGYSDMEISRKRTALENVLIPETFTAHEQRLRQIGFRHCEQWFQCFNFISMVAFK